MTDAYLSNITVKLVDTTVSPNTTTTLEEAISVDPIGESTPILQVTSLTDASHQYIGGLSDGDEFSIECNEVNASPSVQQSFIALKGLSGTLQITFTDTSVSPNTFKRFQFPTLFMNWKYSGAVDEQTKISFSFKINGLIVRSEG